MKKDIEILRTVSIKKFLHIDTKIRGNEESFYVWIDDESKYSSKEKKAVDEVKKLMPEIFI